jgi:hypothetical protein
MMHETSDASMDASSHAQHAAMPAGGRPMQQGQQQAGSRLAAEAGPRRGRASPPTCPAANLAQAQAKPNKPTGALWL